MVALPGAGVPITLMIIPLVAVGVEAEAMVVRQSPEATAVAVALLRLPLWVLPTTLLLPRLPVWVACLPYCRSTWWPAHHTAATKASCLGGLPAMLLRHPLPGGLGVFQKKQRRMEERQVWEQGPDTGRMSCLHLPCSPRPLSLLLPFAFSPLHPASPANIFFQTFKLATSIPGPSQITWREV